MIVVENSFSPPANKNSMQRKVLPTNLAAAPIAVPGSAVSAVAATGRCILRYVPSAAKRPRFPSSQPTDGQSTAALVSPSAKTKKPEFYSGFLVFLSTKAECAEVKKLCSIAESELGADSC